MRCCYDGGMKAHTDYLWFETKERKEIIPITDSIHAAVATSGVTEGLCLVSAMHLTSSVFVQDHEPGLWKDILEWADELAPFADYRHHRTGEDNGDAHLKNLLTHLQVVLPITEGKLDLGPWQQVFYGEWDGQRRKRVIVKIIGI